MRQSETMRNLDVISNKSIRLIALKMNCSPNCHCLCRNGFWLLLFGLNWLINIKTSCHHCTKIIRDQNQHPEVHCREEEGSPAPPEQYVAIFNSTLSQKFTKETFAKKKKYFPNLFLLLCFALNFKSSSLFGFKGQTHKYLQRHLTKQKRRLENIFK